ncbi:MAG: serine hydrolase domain-containing protein [Chloroflexota bacterium]
MRKLISIWFIVAVTLAFLSPGLHVLAQRNAGQRAGRPAFEAAEVESFFDDYLATQMPAHHVAGAMVAVVKDGQVLFTKGYGYADVAQGIPVDPEKTVFVLGSLTKLFTWTAVMQLAEQGKLDLDADINTYLDFELPATYPEPITLNHLMAHTAGFEDNLFAQMAATPEQLTPLGDWLKTHIPARVRPPGQMTAYANYGTTLAGYIIARVSGMSYDEYIEKNILSPLEMTHSSSRQPLPEALNAAMTQSYRYTNGNYQPQPALNVAANVAPAASMRSTAVDLTHFMIAHLNDGRYGDASILQPATCQQMHSQSFSNDPHVNGMAHGFWELDMNGQRIIGHAGSHFIFNSLLMLFPEHNLGVFLATNSYGGNAFIGADYLPFEKAFVNHYFPQEPPTLAPAPGFEARAGRFRGSYHFTMARSESTPQKLSALLMAVNVESDPDGLLLAMPAGKQRFVEVEPLVFRQVDGDDRLVFRQDSSGNITAMFLNSAPLTGMIKNAWYETLPFNLALLSTCAALFLSFLIHALKRLLGRDRPGQLASHATVERAAHLTAALPALLSVPIVLGALASTPLLNIVGAYLGNLPLWPLVSWAAAVVVLCTLGMLVFTGLAWMRGFWSLAGRVHYTLVTLGAVGFVWFLYFWNIFGKRF